MSAVHEWGKKNPLHIRMLSLEIALNALECQTCLTWVKNNELGGHFPEPDIIYWFTLYHKSRHLSRYLQNEILPLDPTAPEALNEYILSYRANSTKNVSEEKEEKNTFWRNYVDSLIKQEKEPSNTKVTDQEKKAVLSTEFYFILKVALPCWLLYQNSHSILFRKAKNGEIAALDKLLRLDKSLIRHPHINKWFTHYHLENNTSAFEKLCNALKNPPLVNLELRTIKDCFAGLISTVTEKLGARLNAPTIQSLFNCIAIDLEKQQLIDEDLPDLPASYSTVILRNRKLWTRILP